MDKFLSRLSPGIVALLLSPFAAMGFLLKLFADTFEYGNGLVEAGLYLELFAFVFWATLAAFSSGVIIWSVPDVQDIFCRWREDKSCMNSLSLLTSCVVLLVFVVLLLCIFRQFATASTTSMSLIRVILDEATANYHP